MDKKVKLFAFLLPLFIMLFPLPGYNPANKQSVLPTSSFETSKPTTVINTLKTTATPYPSNVIPSATTTETNPPDATPDEPTVTVRLTSYSPPRATDQKYLEPFNSALTP